MKTFDVIGIGNAMVDILTHATDDFLIEHDIHRGIMQLIDMDRAVSLYEKIGPAREISGGSAANTIAGLAQLGARTAYVGKVKDDQLGAIFAHDLRAQGATYETPLAAKTHPDETGRCIVLVAPDGERTMNTYLGVSEHLGPEDIDSAQIGQAGWIYLEGYRFDGPQSHAAFAKAIKAVKGTGGKVSLTLSDPFCVDRHRDAFARLIREEADLLFANIHELMAMYPSSSLAETLEASATECDIVVCTNGAQGVHIAQGKNRIHVPAVPTDIVDATGAGDLFASGFLYGLTQGASLEDCGRMGCVAAAEIISHIGARPEADLKTLMTS